MPPVATPTALPGLESYQAYLYDFFVKQRQEEGRLVGGSGDLDLSGYVFDPTLSSYRAYRQAAAITYDQDNGWALFRSYPASPADLYLDYLTDILLAAPGDYNEVFGPPVMPNKNDLVGWDQANLTDTPQWAKDAGLSDLDYATAFSLAASYHGFILPTGEVLQPSYGPGQHPLAPGVGQLLTAGLIIRPSLEGQHTLGGQIVGHYDATTNTLTYDPQYAAAITPDLQAKLVAYNPLKINRMDFYNQIAVQHSGSFLDVLLPVVTAVVAIATLNPEIMALAGIPAGISVEGVSAGLLSTVTETAPTIAELAPVAGIGATSADAAAIGTALGVGEVGIDTGAVLAAGETVGTLGATVGDVAAIATADALPVAPSLLQSLGTQAVKTAGGQVLKTVGGTIAKTAIAGGVSAGARALTSSPAVPVSTTPTAGALPVSYMPQNPYPFPYYGPAPPAPQPGITDELKQRASDVWASITNHPLVFLGVGAVGGLLLAAAVRR